MQLFTPHLRLYPAKRRLLQGCHLGAKTLLRRRGIPCDYNTDIHLPVLGYWCYCCCCFVPAVVVGCNNWVDSYFWQRERIHDLNAEINKQTCTTNKLRESYIVQRIASRLRVRRTIIVSEMTINTRGDDALRNSWRGHDGSYWWAGELDEGGKRKGKEEEGGEERRMTQTCAD